MNKTIFKPSKNISINANSREHDIVFEKITSNKNILSGLTPEILDENGQTPHIETIVPDIDGLSNSKDLTVLGTDYNILHHFDFFGKNITITYDLLCERNLDELVFFGVKIGACYSLCEFEVFGSNEKQTLYDDKNSIGYYFNKEAADIINSGEKYYEKADNGYVKLNGKKARYFGIKFITPSFNDDIVRLCNIFLIDKKFTKQTLYIEKTYGNNILNSAVEFFTNAKIINGKLEYLRDGLSFDTEKRCIAMCDGNIEINAVFAQAAHCAKIVFTGTAQLVKIVADGSSVDFDILLKEGLTEVLFKNPIYVNKMILSFSSNIDLTEIAVFSSAFNFNVNVDNVVNDLYIGNGATIIPSHLMKCNRERFGYNRELFELEKSILKRLKLNVVRLWFQIDWITDNYEDYKNGIYTFNSEKFNACCEYVSALKESGTNVLLNFGWKTDYSITDWFAVEELVGTPQAKNSVPRELDLFAKACCATLIEMIKNRGFDNVKFLTMYNEPNCDGDFSTNLNFITEETFVNRLKYSKELIRNIIYWKNMMNLISDELKSKGLDKKVQMWGPEYSTRYSDPTDFAYIQALIEHKDCPLKVLTWHWYNLQSYQTKLFIKDIRKQIGNYPIVTSEHNTYEKLLYWKNNEAQTLITSSNDGFSGTFHWIGSGGMIPSPVGFSISDFYNLIQLTGYYKNKNRVSPVGTAYEIYALFDNYVPMYSKVVESISPNEDFRIVTFISENKDYTVFVEVNNANDSRNISIAFDKEINRKFYVHDYSKPKNYSVVKTNNFNGTVTPSCGEIEVSDKFTYSVDEKYHLLCFTTIKPIEQIDILNINPMIKAGESAKLEYQLLDVEGDVEWSVLSGNGTVDENGIATLSADSKAGDMVAVKANIKNSDAYAVAIIECIEE